MTDLELIRMALRLLDQRYRQIVSDIALDGPAAEVATIQQLIFYNGKAEARLEEQKFLGELIDLLRCAPGSEEIESNPTQ